MNFSRSRAILLGVSFLSSRSKELLVETSIFHFSRQEFGRSTTEFDSTCSEHWQRFHLFNLFSSRHKFSSRFRPQLWLCCQTTGVRSNQISNVHFSFPSIDSGLRRAESFVHFLRFHFVSFQEIAQFYVDLNFPLASDPDRPLRFQKSDGSLTFGMSSWPTSTDPLRCQSNLARPKELVESSCLSWLVENLLDIRFVERKLNDLITDKTTSNVEPIKSCRRFYLIKICWTSVFSFGQYWKELKVLLK